MATKATLNLRIDKELKERLTEKLKTTGETATDVITRAIEAYCNDVTPSSNDSNDSVTLRERVASLEEKQEAMAEAIALQDDFTSKLNEQLESLQCNAVTLTSIQGWACPLPPVTQSSNAVTPNRNDDVTHSASPPVTTGSNATVTRSKGSVITSDDERDYDYSSDTVTHPSNDTVTTEKPPSEIATEEVKPTGKDKSPSEISKTPEEAKTVAVEGQGENSINYSAIADSLPDEINKTKLAKAYGVPESSLREWLSGKSNPRGKRGEIWEAIQRDWKWDQDRKKWIRRK